MMDGSTPEYILKWFVMANRPGGKMGPFHDLTSKVQSWGIVSKCNMTIIYVLLLTIHCSLFFVDVMTKEVEAFLSCEIITLL